MSRTVTSITPFIWSYPQIHQDVSYVKSRSLTEKVPYGMCEPVICYMDTNHLHTHLHAQTRQAAINGLAVVGFIALVGAGIWFAVYSTRFVPTVVNNLGAAAVYLG